MDSQVKRVIGFILYYRGKVVTRACNFCVRVDELKTSDICKVCKTIIDHPNYKERGKYFLEDWYNRKDGQHEKDFPWEVTLPDGALNLLDKAEGKVFTSDEVVKLVHDIIKAILTTPHSRIEDVVDEIFLEKKMILKKSSEDWADIETHLDLWCAR